MVVPFGVGAIYDYRNYSAVTMSVDEWEIKENSNRQQKLSIKNPRLLSFVNRILRKREGENFSRVSYLCLPPIAFDADMPRDLTDIMLPIPVRKFPSYYTCPTCSALSKPHPTDDKLPRCSNADIPSWRASACISQRYKPILEPVRFIGFCSRGHLQDIPWEKIMASACDESCVLLKTANPIIYLSDDGNGYGFASLNLTCGHCKKRKNLSGLNATKKEDKAIRDKNGKKILLCDGNCPWTNDPNEECGIPLEVEPRGASRIYLSDQATGLYIPEKENTKHKIHDEYGFINILDKKGEEKSEEIIKQLIEIQNLVEISGSLNPDPALTMEQIYQLIVEENQRNSDLLKEDINEEIEEEDFFFEEYETLKSNFTKEENLYESKEIPLTQFSPVTQKYFASMHEIKTLQSTTALLGFRRSGSEDSTFRASRKKANYLSAYQVSGEGIFMNFEMEKINKWLLDNAEFDKKKMLLKMHADNDFFNHSSRMSEPGFVMLHTLSHVLMKQISIECGYGLNELQERIYFSSDKEMAGILIFTSSSDSSGSLGGLVRMIRPEFFDGMFMNAINNSLVCSNDPICEESEGQGSGGLCLAACHACAMVPDLACSTFPKNCFLDRTTLIGIRENAKGFFADL